MLLFVGLGNPGPKYQNHRHNIGFKVVEAIADENGFGPEKARFQGLTRDGRLGLEKVLILKPTTFMNESGRAVGAAMHFFKLTPADVTVFYDELDLAEGKVRVRMGGGAAGHNGIRSIAAHIGADFKRVRLGIGHPGRPEAVTSHVLGDFAKRDAPWRDAVINESARAADLLAKGDDSGFMNKLALAVQAATEK